MEMYLKCRKFTSNIVLEKGRYRWVSIVYEIKSKNKDSQTSVYRLIAAREIELLGEYLSFEIKPYVYWRCVWLIDLLYGNSTRKGIQEFNEKFCSKWGFSRNWHSILVSDIGFSLSGFMLPCSCYWDSCSKFMLIDSVCICLVLLVSFYYNFMIDLLHSHILGYLFWPSYRSQTHINGDRRVISRNFLHLPIQFSEPR